MLLVVMLFAFGPKRILEIGKSLGEALSSFRKATRETEPQLDRKEPEAEAEQLS